MRPSSPSLVLSGSMTRDPAGPTWPSTKRCSKGPAAGERWLRLYGWNPFCLSFGRNEPATRRYDAERIERLGLESSVALPAGGPCGTAVS